MVSCEGFSRAFPPKKTSPCPLQLTKGGDRGDKASRALLEQKPEDTADNARQVVHHDGLKLRGEAGKLWSDLGYGGSWHSSMG
ncbi:hypothetical protein JZ751_023248 [Albula glossodonta]|uniref:Uncharacterized protein n=1 Tax=Albula glossodonta TaxID=121402 RepID=A0A8T2PNH5_9TELE|nr:hypothetical protein JZ751_023248 [Albula glossodonta]